MNSRVPVTGDVFAFPLEDGRFGACRILHKVDGRESAIVACSAWIGDAIPDVNNSHLRDFLYLTHHSHKGDAHIIWVTDALPTDFIHLGTIEPTPAERSFNCRSFSVWECITEQPLMQSRWDLDQDAVRAQEAFDRLRPGEILFGIPHLDQSTGEVIEEFRRWGAMFVRALAVFALLIGFHSVILHVSPIIAWGTSAVATLAVYSLASVLIQYRYERRIPWQKAKVSGVEVNRVYRGPNWLKRACGKEPKWLIRISCVSLNRKVVSAGVLARIRSFPEVSMISLFESQIDESGLRHLSKLKSLEIIWLSESNLTDQGMRHLGRCHQLEWLSLNGTGITDAGLVELSRLRKIRNLDLCKTSISDLKAIQHWDRLRTLQLNETLVTDSSLRYLADLQLENLDLNATAISNTGLATLASQKSLKRLQLNRTAVSDDGLAHLRCLNQLEWIHLANTQVTIQGLFMLESLPNLVGIFLGNFPNLDAIRRTFPQWKILSEL